MNDVSQGSNRSTIIEEENSSCLHLKPSTRQMLERLARSADPPEEESSEDDDSSEDYDASPPRQNSSPHQFKQLQKFPMGQSSEDESSSEELSDEQLRERRRNNADANIREATVAREYAEWLREQQREEGYRKKCVEAEEDLEQQYQSFEEEHSEILASKEVIKPAKNLHVTSSQSIQKSNVTGSNEGGSVPGDSLNVRAAGRSNKSRATSSNVRAAGSNKRIPETSPPSSPVKPSNKSRATSKSTRPKRKNKKPKTGEPLSLGAKPSRPHISKLPDRPTKTSVLKGVVSNKVPKASYLKQINTANKRILDLKSCLETHRKELEEKHSQLENIDAAFEYIDEQDAMIAYL